MLHRFYLPLLLALASLAVVVGIGSAEAADEVFVTADGAIRGYDPVAYHTRARPVPGRADITLTWNGATWRFASEANRSLFAADPERYAPRYGGFCAYGTSRGYKVSTDPWAFAIVDGRLYLNYSLSVQKTWTRTAPAISARRTNSGACWNTLHTKQVNDAAAARAHRPDALRALPAAPCRIRPHSPLV